MNKPTRIMESSATLLYHMYTNTTKSTTNKGILTYEISDHLPTFRILAKRPSYYAPDKIMIRDLKKFNSDKFLDDINNLSLKTKALISGYENYRVNKTITQFLEGFSKIANEHALLRPQTKKEIKLNEKPWLNNGILKFIQTKNALFKTILKKNDSVLIENYKKYFNKLTTIKKTSKQNYYAHMIQFNKNDLSKQW